MKVCVCFGNGDIHIRSFTEHWTKCECGNVRVKWDNPQAGTVIVAAFRRDCVRMIGLHNSYLVGAIQQTHVPWEHKREMHDDATTAPGYIFDKAKAGCWAVVFEVGQTQDVRWATDEEFAEAFSEPAPALRPAGENQPS